MHDGRTPIPNNAIYVDVNSAGEGKIVINGFDLSTVVAADWEIRSDGDLSEPILTIHVLGAVKAHASGAVGVDDETAAALAALGWTPPQPATGGHDAA